LIGVVAITLTNSMTEAVSIVCAGLSCLDLQLLGCTQSGAEESIEHYDEAQWTAGGSASMTATTLALITKSPTQIFVLTKLGKDYNGNTMLDFYTRSGAKTDLVLVDPKVQTSMAVLPVFKAGGRGCFVNLACNEGFTTEELLGRLDSAPSNCKAFLFGYPHLLPSMQGGELKEMLCSAKSKLGPDCLFGVDLNGVSVDNHRESLLQPALENVDVLHLNEEEASILCGGEDVSKLHKDGCAVVVLSLGSRGAKVSISSDSDRLSRCPGHIKSWTPGSTVHVPAFKINGDINANGAGDALFSGFCLAAVWSSSSSPDATVSLKQAAEFSSLVARQRCDAITRETPAEAAEELMQRVFQGKLPEPL